MLLPIYLFSSFVVVAYEESDHYLQAACWHFDATRW
jgi:hypothetical protein